MITKQEFKQIDFDDEIWIFGVPYPPSRYAFPGGKIPLSDYQSKILIAVQTKVTSVSRIGLDTISFSFEYDGIVWNMHNLFGHEFVHQVIKPKPTQQKSSVVTVSGPLSCVKCNTTNEYAEPNLPEGKLICYSCRLEKILKC